MLTLNEIREKFLKFFESKGCKILPASSLVPDDPTLLFTNSGMVQFKNYYKGIEKPKFTRVTTAQKSVRAGGKHNDLDNVGYTARHHTFFEMLGNFSFGDYFKKEAITWAWEFLTKILQIPAEKLCVTVYFNDDEAYKIWHEVVGLPTDRIIKISSKDNFWEMGDTGPCGPCSEIFYDHGPEVAGGMPGTPDEDGDRYIEIWNIVFTQFNRNEKGELDELPKKNIDTGMGLERIAAVLQGVHNNYDIDLFKKLIDNSKNIIGDGDIFSHRIIADHLRSSSFLVADGVLPSNEGRGYVLRRIMRRAMLQVYKLGCKDISMYRLVPCLVDLMGDAYPELRKNESLIMETLKIEEEKFRATLEKGLKRLDEKIQKTENNILSGKDAFELYDTYGFPLDLTEILLKEKNIIVDEDEFDIEMKKQKEKSKENWVGSGDKATKEIYLKIEENTNFYYDKEICSGKILKIIKNDSFVDEVGEGETVDIITDNTCFYGEMGGQVGDTGIIMLTKNNMPVLPFTGFQVTNTIKCGNVTIHQGKVEMGNFRVGDSVSLAINTIRRKQIAANHSATHLLHFALRKFLGDSLVQKGSLVDEKKLRFDVSCNGIIEKDILEKVEVLVNSIIMENTEVQTEIMNIEEAKKTGAMALFNEKYGDSVRVVSMGRYKDSGNDFKYYSSELCGGTHVKSTGDIGFFKIVKEESIASGVRRLEAITGIEALNFVNEKINILNCLEENLKTGADALVEKVKDLQKENKELKKQINDAEKSKLNSLQFTEENFANVKISYKVVENINPQDMKQVIVGWQNTKYKENSIVVAICKNGEKNTIIVAVSKNLCDKYDAKALIKKLGGKGGGVTNFAMGSCESYNIDINKIKNIL